MKQYQAVIKVMEDNGGYATLGYLNQHVLKIEECEWKTKTPFASIRRIVQDDRFFFKIRPGLWALKSYKNKLPLEIFPTNDLSTKEKEEYSHSYYQGLIVEIGNLKNFRTFVPNQDKNKSYLGRRLGEIATINEFYKFTYENITKQAATVDVSWFNVRKMPSKLFEIEHSTDIQRSLSKFVELQDFNVKFYIVADEHRRREFESKLALNAYTSIQKTTKFMDYIQLAEWHTKTHEISRIEDVLNL
jgi:hypothetical protein